MEFKFNMEVDTPKQKVSAIRKVVALSSLSYDERLLAVKKILWDFDPVSKPVTPPTSTPPAAISSSGTTTVWYRRMLDVPMERRKRVLDLLLSREPTTNPVVNNLKDRLDGNKGIGCNPHVYDTGFNELWYNPYTKMSSGILTSALLLGFERGEIAMTLAVRNGQRNWRQKARFHTSKYAAAHPEIKWEAYSLNMVSTQDIWTCLYNQNNFSGNLGK